MSRDFKNCLDKKKLYRSDAFSPEGAEVSVGNAKGFLHEAKRIFEGVREKKT